MNNIVAFDRNKDTQNFTNEIRNAHHLIEQAQPSLPTYLLDLDHIAGQARIFLNNFDGTTMFAVKTNPCPQVIDALYRSGVQAFDVTSIPEIELVKSIAPDADLYFMHTIKAPEAIRAAYFDYGIRRFSLDHMDELEKILNNTNNAQDLELFVRTALPRNDDASIDLSCKFGALPDEAIPLLQKTREHAQKLGICFHVGTQTSNAASYGNAINIIKALIKNSGISIEMLDIGGGFPVPYEGEDVPSIENCLDVVKTALHHADLDHLELLAEPGRCLVAQGGALIVRVELRKGDLLYLNDGTYGGLFDAGPMLKTPFPVEGHRVHGTFDEQLSAFSFAGPTCDSLDMMEGPFMLPADIKTGDWIEIKNTGAYSQSLRTDFNGFGTAHTVFISR